jgi:predicted metal-dependent HD superfamily phosphohydrolase
VLHLHDHERGTWIAHRHFMSKHDKDIVRSAADQVFALYRNAAHDSALVYHGYDRARELVKACREIAKGCELGEDEIQIALLAAWFHDAGYAAGAHADGVESVAMATRFVTENGGAAELADAVAACMRATHDGVLQSAAQEVLHDALLVATADKDYPRALPLLRLERERRGAPALSDVEWTESCIRFVEQHPFRTRYAQLEYNRGRAENLVRLHDQLREQREEAAEERARAEKAEKGLGKTVEDLYDDITKNQLKILTVADRRTATMVHVNAIMISLIAALLLRHVESHPRLLAPTLILLAVNLLAIFISILSMRAPRSMKGLLRGLSGQEAAACDKNLLLSLNPMATTRDDYYDEMEKLARDLPALRTAMIDATYFGRRILNWRAQMLRVTYDVFLGGLFLAVFAFVIAALRK